VVRNSGALYYVIAITIDNSTRMRHHISLITIIMAHEIIAISSPKHLPRPAIYPRGITAVLATENKEQD